MAGPVDLQGFRSQNLVNISEALYGLLESPRRLEGGSARVRVCLPHILPLPFTSASVHHQEGKRKRKRRPAVVHCLPDQNGKRAGEGIKKKKKQQKGRPRASERRQVCSADVLRQLLLFYHSKQYKSERR